MKINFFHENKRAFQRWHQRIFEDAALFKGRLAEDKSRNFIFAAHVATQYLLAAGLPADRLSGVLDNNPDKVGRRLYGHRLWVSPPTKMDASQLTDEGYRVAVYDARYDAGWDQVRKERWQRQQTLGLPRNADLAPVELDLGPPYDFPEALEILGPGEVNRPAPWSTLTDDQQAFQATKMAIHAAMIDRMDREIGRVIDQLKTMKAYENTLIVFLSDNGASAEIMVRADGHDPKAAPGSAATYLCLGPGWSTTCNTPFRKHKTWVHEGGIATPFIARWPTTVEKRPTIDRPSHVIDLVPTILDLAGIEKPTRPGIGLFETPKASRELWWMHEGNRAIRRGDWKLVAVKDKPWELYDLSKDRAETKDIAGEKPDKAAELAKQWDSLWEGFQKDAQSPKGG